MDLSEMEKVEQKQLEYHELRLIKTHINKAYEILRYHFDLYNYGYVIEEEELSYKKLLLYKSTILNELYHDLIIIIIISKIEKELQSNEFVCSCQECNLNDDNNMMY